MNVQELGQILRQMYETAKRNEAACQVHLFGIKYAREIQENGYYLKDILKASGISQGYLAELSKGVKLAQYVELKK